MNTLHFLFFIFCGIEILAVIGNIANIQACTSYDNCVRTLPHSTTQTASFNGNHTTYGIPYILSNATLVTSLLDLPARELIFEFNVTDAGQLMVELPRSIIDSTRDGNDKPYLIFVGDILSGTKRVKANEVQTTDTNRTLKINFTKNDNMIGIVGTYFIESNSTTKTRNGYGAWSPLQQYQKGFDAQDIVCKNEFILVIKTEDGSPACVKPEHVTRLIQNGWTLSNPFNRIADTDITNNTVKSSVNPDNQTSSTLKLFISTDSTYTSPGNPVGVDISLNNTGSTPLILTKSDNWPRNDLSSGPCSNLPFGMAILKGYYTEQNMSNANSLVIFQNIPCPLPAKIKSYTFQPLSSKATQECDSLFSCTGLVDMKTHLEISGFVDNNSPHHPFSIGTYTIIAGDQWGHVAIQHFSEAYTTPLANLKGN